MTAASITLLAWLALNVWATKRVLASDSEGFRRGLFVASVWLIPVFGALIVKNLPARSAIGNPFPDAPGAHEVLPETVDLGQGRTLRLDTLLAAPHGYPIVRADAAQTWLSDLAPSASAAAADRLQRAWLLHLRQALGSGFELHEADDARVLTSLDAVRARALLKYVGTTRARIVRLLDGVAQFPVQSRSALVVLDDEDSYYQYVSAYYPETGEFAFSGGMFIAGSCPHFVVKRAEVSSVEPVIAHEMTHSALAHLRLPRWLDEGLAVNAEHRLAATRLDHQHTPQQLHGKHQAFWTASTIQEFWSGKSFFRTDDGNLLSYDLARVLVGQLASDWSSFAEFVRHASAHDGGVSSAHEHLGTDLPASVQALFGKEGEPGWEPSLGQLA